MVIRLFNIQFKEVGGVMAAFTAGAELAVVDILLPVTTATQRCCLCGIATGQMAGRALQPLMLAAEFEIGLL